MRHTLISFIIGLLITTSIAGLVYEYEKEKLKNDSQRTNASWFETINFFQNKIDDLKLTTRPFTETKAPVVLVAIDDASIEEIGRWPWSRTTLAQMASEVLSRQAKTLTLDLMLSEPERENSSADQELAQIINRYSDQVILGTASHRQYPSETAPYQDICTAEAFLYLGGDHIVTLNPTFAVDDQTENFEAYTWKPLFEKIFQTLDNYTEKNFLDNLNEKNKAHLTLYQTNSLTAQKTKNIYNYCFHWLTDTDPFLEKSVLAKIHSYYEQAVGHTLTAEQLRHEIQNIKKKKAHPLPQYLSWSANTPLIQNAAKYTASFNVRMDADGMIRKYPLFYRIGSKIGLSYIPSLALQTYLLARNSRAEVSITESDNPQQKKLESFKIFSMDNDKTPIAQLPVDQFSQITLNYYGPEKSFYTVSAKELLTKKQNLIEVQKRENNALKVEMVDKNIFFKDKSVFIGVTALGVYDVRNTPLQNAFPGPEIHLTALANLFENNSLTRVGHEAWLASVITLFIGLVLTTTWMLTSALTSVALFIGICCLLLISDYQFFLKTNHLIDSWSVYFVTLSTFMGLSVYKYFSEERNKLKVRQAFSKYVSPSIVEELLKSDKNLELGGTKKHLTVLFSDLRGFTTFSEKLEPQQLSEFLNLYLTQMTAEIFKAHGTLDKFIGDAIMAFFGAPVSYPNHAEKACEAALASLEQLKKLNSSLKKKNFPHLEMGIGINTGEMSVGNMGSSTVQNYTVMGDSVNLASRLEGLTRLYGNFITIGPQTYSEIKETFTCRELDEVIVKGKTQALRIYDLLYKGPIRHEDQDWLQSFQKARDLYRSGNFLSAQELFKKCQELQPSDLVSVYYIERCQKLIEFPPTEEWTGVSILRTK